MKTARHYYCCFPGEYLQEVLLPWAWYVRALGLLRCEGLLQRKGWNLNWGVEGASLSLRFEV